MEDSGRAANREVDEAFVALVWERQAFDASRLADLGLSVVFRGVPSDGGGADYQEAILARSDGMLVSGDVEFHVRASGWYVHGHARDPSYNRVVLHVVWAADGKETRREDGVVVPTLELEECCTLDHFVSEAPVLAPHPCITTLAGIAPGAVKDAVDMLGWIRFQARRDQFIAELESDSEDQVAYRALLEGLGHASNRQAFRELSEAVPYAWLMSVPESSRAPALLSGAGLTSVADVAPPAHLEGRVWRLSRLRPGNHPVRRIGAVARLLDRFSPSLAAGLVDTVSTSTRPSQLREGLISRGPGDAVIGAGRADEIAVSAVLPLVAALAPGLEAPRRLYSLYPSPPATRWTRSMNALLTASGHELPVTRALRHQGLHLLYTRYCRREGPAECPICGRAGFRENRFTRSGTPPGAAPPCL